MDCTNTGYGIYTVYDAGSDNICSTRAVFRDRGVDVPVRLENGLPRCSTTSLQQRMSIASCLEETLPHTLEDVGPHTKSDLGISRS